MTMRDEEAKYILQKAADGSIDENEFYRLRELAREDERRFPEECDRLYRAALGTALETISGVAIRDHDAGYRRMARGILDDALIQLVMHLWNSHEHGTEEEGTEW